MKDLRYKIIVDAHLSKNLQVDVTTTTTSVVVVVGLLTLTWNYYYWLAAKLESVKWEQQQ